jgi:hypothetical protein
MGEAVIIGQDPDGYASTWGSMRGAFYNSTYGNVEPNRPASSTASLGWPTKLGVLIHSRTYIDADNGVTFPPTWFLDESGSLFRTYPEQNPGLWWGEDGEIPRGYNGLFYFGATPENQNHFPMANEEFEEFVDKVLESPEDSLTVDEDANTDGQSLPSGFGAYPGFTTIEGMIVIP